MLNAACQIMVECYGAVIHCLPGVVETSERPSPHGLATSAHFSYIIISCH